MLKRILESIEKIREIERQEVTITLQSKFGVKTKEEVDAYFGQKVEIETEDGFIYQGILRDYKYMIPRHPIETGYFVLEEPSRTHPHPRDLNTTIKVFYREVKNIYKLL